MSRTLSGIVPDLPVEVPAGITWTFGFLGILPAANLPRRWQPWFRAYQRLIIVFAAAFLLELISQCYLGLASKNFNPIAAFFLLRVSVAWIPCWLLAQREMDCSGPTLALLQQMSRRGFLWSSLMPSLKAAWGAVSFFVLVVSIFLGRGLSTGSMPNQVAMAAEDDTTAVLARASVIATYFQIPGILFWCSASLLTSWTFHLFAKLHEHEIIWYAGALSQVLEDDEAADPLPALKIVELLVTARMRHASTSWVRAAVVSVMLHVLEMVVFVSYLISGRVRGGHAQFYVGLALLTSMLFAIVLAVPIARLSETFEYDVFLPLNNPVVVQRAQRHFGQQLLPHLKALDWGFRLGGSVINMRIIMNIFVAVLLSVTTTAAQLVISTVQPE